jgi:hypothetical protein
MMRLIYPWVCVEAGIVHNPVDEVIDHCGDAVDTAESFVKAGAKVVVAIAILVPMVPAASLLLDPLRPSS